MVNALFSITDPANHVISATFPFPQGAQYPICAFDVNLVGPGNLSNTTLTSGAGLLTYSVFLWNPVCAEWRTRNLVRRVWRIHRRDFERFLWCRYAAIRFERQSEPVVFLEGDIGGAWECTRRLLGW